MIPLIGEDEIIKKRKRISKSKRKYENIRPKVLKLVSQIYDKIDNDKDCCYWDGINLKIRDIAKDIGLQNKSNTTVYTALRYLLFYEGLYVRIVEGEFLVIRRVHHGDGFGESLLKTFDNVELDGWCVKRNYDFLNAKHGIKKDKEKGIYTLESEGDIYFDRRNLTNEQTIEFVKYMSSKRIRAGDLIYNTPVNVTLSDDYIKLINDKSRYNNIDIDKIGREFRIVKSCNNDGFIVTSIYGKECLVQEYDVDELIRGNNIYTILYSFDRALMVEKVPERIIILKKILPDIKTRNIAMIDGNNLIISNGIGNFKLSLVDGTLHKIDEKNNTNKYICVGPANTNKKGFIIYNGIKYELDRMMDIILSKMIMLLEEKYPDESTKMQCLS